MNGIVRRITTAKPRAYNDGTRRIRFCFSDSSVDRMNDTIDATGWDLHNFNKNPVALWAHDSNAPPIGKASNLLVEGERLMGDIEFASADQYAFADTIYRLCKGGYITATSVGFLPIEWKRSSDPDREFGIDYTRTELLEVSVVPVPANANALSEARAKGINIKPLVRWARGVQRQAESDDATTGNCGRPLDKECGMKDPSECSIHGFGQVGQGSPEEAAERIALLAESRQLRHLARIAPSARLLDVRQRELEEQLAPRTLAEVRNVIAAERRLGLSKPLIATIASARLMRW